MVRIDQEDISKKSMQDNFFAYGTIGNPAAACLVETF
jgi:hypothetical protein